MQDDGCHQALSTIQTFLDGECGAALERAIREHLGGCTHCLHRADFERALRAVVATSCRESAPSDLVERIIHVLGDR